MNLIGEEYNRELLEGIPHKKFLDMAVIYRIIMKEDAHGMWTVLITDDLLKELNLTEEELDQLALENTKRLFPAMVTKMSDLFYVITNKSKIHGATVIMYEEELKSLAEQLGGGFYLLPSSIHEVIAVPEDILTVKDLICILEEGNRMESVKNESLSNSIYYYCQEKETIFMAASYYAESFQY